MLTRTKKYQELREELKNKDKPSYEILEAAYNIVCEDMAILNYPLTIEHVGLEKTIEYVKKDFLEKGEENVKHQ